MIYCDQCLHPPKLTRAALKSLAQQSPGAVISVLCLQFNSLWISRSSRPFHPSLANRFYGDGQDVYSVYPTKSNVGTRLLVISSEVTNAPKVGFLRREFPEICLRA